MAASIYGLAGTTFGTPTNADMVVQSASFSESINIAEVIDEDGDYAAAALHGKKVTASISGVAKGDTLAIGATLTIAGAPTHGTYIITERSMERSADGFMTMSISATAWGFTVA